MSVMPIESATRQQPGAVAAEPAAAEPILVSLQAVALATTANLSSPVVRRSWLRRLALLLTPQHAAVVPATTDRVSPSHVPPLRPEYMEKSAMLREMRRL